MYILYSPILYVNITLTYYHVPTTCKVQYRHCQISKVNQHLCQLRKRRFAQFMQIRKLPNKTTCLLPASNNLVPFSFINLLLVFCILFAKFSRLFRGICAFYYHSLQIISQRSSKSSGFCPSEFCIYLKGQCNMSIHLQFVGQSKPPGALTNGLIYFRFWVKNFTEKTYFIPRSMRLQEIRHFSLNLQQNKKNENLGALSCKGTIQGWEFAHRISEQIASFLPKSEQRSDSLKK